MSSPTNQTTLFRFQTLRSPELTDKIYQKNRFVFHPYNSDDTPPATGNFFDAVLSKPPSQTIWNALVGESVSFESASLKSVSDFEAIDATFDDVAVWISKNRLKKTIPEILAKLEDPALTVLSEANELLIWDNLFYQIVTQKSFYIKERVIEWLILNNTLHRLSGLTTSQKESLVLQLLEAKVILPTLLFGESPQIEASTSKAAVTKDFFESQDLLEIHDAFNAKNEAGNIEAAVREVKKVEKQYNIENNKLLKEAIKAHKSAVDLLMKKYSENYIEEAKKTCTSPSSNISEFCKSPFVKYPDLPDFTYEPLDIATVLKAKISPESHEVIDSIIDITTAENFHQIYEQLEDALNDRNKVFSNKQFSTSRSVMAIGDIVIPTDNLNRAERIAFKLCVDRIIRDRFMPYITLVLPDPSYQVASCRYTISFANTTNYTSESVNTIMMPSGTQLEFLFHNAQPTPLSNTPGIPISMGTTIVEISGTITFTNGQIKTFKANGISTAAATCYGNFLEDKLADEHEETSMDSDSFVPLGFGFRQLGIADYKKVVQEICCYKPGEVAHIENIMAREFKEKTTEKTVTQETTISESEEIERESLSDSSSTQRFEMQTEIAKILQEQQQFTAYANVQGSSGTMTFDAGGSYASNISKEESNRQAVTQAKDITERAMERIVSRIKKEKIVKITESFKDTNSHIFDNRQGENHVSGVYRFVNAVYKNQVYNYGKRLMYEFMIPQPSKLHRLGKGASSSDLNAQILEIPLDPRTHGIKDFRDVNSGNYMELASKYSAEVAQYPAPSIYLNKTFSGGVELRWDPRSGGAIKEDANLKIPEGYRTVYASIDARRDYDDTFYRAFGVCVGNIKFWVEGRSSATSQYLDAFTDTISVSCQTLNSIGYNVAISILCMPTDDGIIRWKKETFEAILAGYEKQLQEYNEKLEQIKAKGVQILDSNPLFYRQIEQLVLRKNCISYLIDDTNEQSKRRFGRLMYNADAVFTNHQVTVDKDMDNYGSFAKFMEQAFEWDNMSYNFYPFYWGYRGDWDELYQYETNDPTFRSFMQAGMARVVATVRPGFEYAVMHYMAFGQIWNGGRLPVLGDPLYLSIVDELKEQEYVIEDSWETVLPTNLIALQSSGVALSDTGLPCSPECEDEEENPFGESMSKLGISDAPIES